MSRVLESLCSRSSARTVALALVTTAVAACSADTSRSNSNPEATGSISQTEAKQVEWHRDSRTQKHSPPTSARATAARRAATPDITGSVVRKPRSAHWTRNGRTMIAVTAGETVARRAETASTEPRGAAADSAVSWPNLPTLNLDARKPGTINNTDARENEPKDGEEEMPLIWPILSEADHAGLPDSAPESVLSPAFLVGALAMVLLGVGAIFKARSSSRSSHSLARDPRPASPESPDALVI
jgi:hypothetical protein